MDGMSVGVGGEVYICHCPPCWKSLPESKERRGVTVGQGSQLVKGAGRVHAVVGELEKCFRLPRFDFDRQCDIMVVVEADGSQVALLVDGAGSAASSE